MQQIIYEPLQHPKERSIEKGKQLQLSLSRSTPFRSQDVTHVEKDDDESLNLDEVITLPKYDLNNLTLDKFKNDKSCEL